MEATIEKKKEAVLNAAKECGMPTESAFKYILWTPECKLRASKKYEENFIGKI